MRILLLLALIGLGLAAHALAQSTTQLSQSKLLTGPVLSPPLDEIADSKTMVFVVGTIGAVHRAKGILPGSPLPTHLR